MPGAKKKKKKKKKAKHTHKSVKQDKCQKEASYSGSFKTCMWFNKDSTHAK